MSEVYEPAEDSFLFAEFLKNNLQDTTISLLDMGCGSCILGDTAKAQGIQNITCADINKEAIKIAKEKGYKAIESNLFENITEFFDIITFNAPYLPQDGREPVDSQTITTGGTKGDEIPLEFIKQAKEHLNKNGIIYLLISSLTPMDNIQKYNPEIVARKKVFFEELLVLKIQ